MQEQEGIPSRRGSCFGHLTAVSDVKLTAYSRDWGFADSLEVLCCKSRDELHRTERDTKEPHGHIIILILRPHQKIKTSLYSQKRGK